MHFENRPIKAIYIAKIMMRGLYIYAIHYRSFFAMHEIGDLIRLLHKKMSMGVLFVSHFCAMTLILSNLLVVTHSCVRPLSGTWISRS